MLTLAAVWTARLIVAAIFGLAAWGKFADRAGTRQALQEFGVPGWLVPFASWALPGVELVLAAAVLPPASAVVACGGVAVLLVIFTAAIAWQLRRGERPRCSCFGETSSAPINAWTLVRNAGILALVAAALWGSRAHGGAPTQLPAEWTVGLAAIVLFAALLTRQAATLRDLRRQLAELRTGLPKPEGLPVGTPAPAFELPNTDGGRSSLTDLLALGRPVVLIFLHPDCGPCQDLAGELSKWRQSHPGKLSLVPIGGGDPAANDAWARRHDLGSLLVQDAHEVMFLYRVRGTPTAVFIDARGRISRPPARGPREIRELVADLTGAAPRSGPGGA